MKLHVLAGLLAVSTMAGISPLHGKSAAPGNSRRQVYAIQRVPLAGNGRGDYLTVDAGSNRLFVTHGPRVHIVALDTLSEVATVTGLRSSHGVALAHGVGFVADGTAGEVVVFDPVNGAVQAHVKVALGADALAYDTVSDRIIVLSGYARSATVIDPNTKAIVGTVALDDRPEAAQSDGKGYVWTNLPSKGRLVRLDPRKLAVDAGFALPGCEDPGAIGLDRADGQLLIACGNRVMVAFDIRLGRVVDKAPIGDDADGIGYDETRHLVFVTNRDATMTVIERLPAGRYAFRQTVATEPLAKTVAVDGDRHRVLSSTAELIAKTSPAGKPLPPDVKPDTFHLLVIQSH